MLKVMTESKETREGETLSCSHGKNMKYRGCDSSHAPIVEGTDDVEIDIHGANECRPNSPALEELIVHSNSDIFGTLVLKSKCLRVEYHGKPISRKDGKEKECLKVMVEFPLGVSNRVIRTCDVVDLDEVREDITGWRLMNDDDSTMMIR